RCDPDRGADGPGRAALRLKPFPTGRRWKESHVQRHLVAWLVWWIALFWLWMLLVGDWNEIEWIGGACVTAVAATVAELARVVARQPVRIAVEPFRASAMVLPIV